MDRQTAADELGIDQFAGPEEIEAAYKQMVRRTHPDVGGSAEQFERVTKARTVLSQKQRSQPVMVIRRRSVAKRLVARIKKRRQPPRVQ